MKFKYGDRVMVYGWVQMLHPPYALRAGGKATVTYVGVYGVHVRFDTLPNGLKVIDEELHYFVHPKQCRKLVKKERGRIWVKWDENMHTLAEEQVTMDYIEYAEVRKKK